MRFTSLFSVIFCHKLLVMKKALVVVLLMAGIGAVAFASFSNKKRSDSSTEKKAEKKKECRHKCMFSL